MVKFELNQGYSFYLARKDEASRYASLKNQLECQYSNWNQCIINNNRQASKSVSRLKSIKMCER